MQKPQFRCLPNLRNPGNFSQVFDYEGKIIILSDNGMRKKVGYIETIGKIKYIESF